MANSREAANEQRARWSGPAGRAWVEAQKLVDRAFKPIEDLLAGTAAGAAATVLDVGCGTGATTLAIARRLGPGGGAVGIDISEPMIAAARARADRQCAVTFICADAQEHPFEAAAFDAIVSRFGVMFFGDPVAAFANLRRAAKEQATLRVVAWRSADENPFMTTAERAAAPLLPDLPPRQGDGPGQFAFADRRRIHSILEASGWVNIDIQPLDVACTLPEAELPAYLTRLGPVGLALQDADAETRARILGAVRPAFDRYIHCDEVRFTAACWLAGAQAA